MSSQPTSSSFACMALVSLLTSLCRECTLYRRGVAESAKPMTRRPSAKISLSVPAPLFGCVTRVPIPSRSCASRRGGGGGSMKSARTSSSSSLSSNGVARPSCVEHVQVVCVSLNG